MSWLYYYTINLGLGPEFPASISKEEFVEKIKSARYAATTFIQDQPGTPIAYNHKTYTWTQGRVTGTWSLTLRSYYIAPNV
jgi:hypothetical protein